MSSTERVESSFAVIPYVDIVGSQFESSNVIVGMPNL
jgi:hypothetical protein